MARNGWIIVLLLSVGAAAWAQPNPITRWTHAIVGDSIDAATGIVQATDGTYMVCGYTASSGWTHGGWDMYVAKLDSLGNSPWYQTYGGVYHDAALAMCRTADNMFVLAGYTQTYHDGPLNVYLIKINSNGLEQWNMTYSGVAEEYVNDVQQTSDGGYILTGSTDSGIAQHVYVRKTDARGNPQWTAPSVSHNTDEGFAIRQTHDGGYIIAGYTTYQQRDGWLVKINSSGSMTWNRYIGQAGDEELHAVKETADKGFILAGKSNSETGDDRPYLVRTDSLGHEQWHHSYGLASLSGGFYAVDTLADDNYIVAGDLGGEMYLVRTDSAGTVRWEESYNNAGTETAAAAMQVTHDACYALAGYNVSSSGNNWDMYAVKTGRDRLTPQTAADPRTATLPQRLSFSAFPNPFNSRTVLDVQLPQQAQVRIELYDLNGRRVREIVNREYDPGEHRFAFDGAILPSGVYFARLTTPSFIATQKLLLMK